MYKKYELATAIEVVIPTKIISPSDFAVSDVLFSAPNCKPRLATKPYASMPNNARGTPESWRKRIIIRESGLGKKKKRVGTANMQKQI